MKTNSTQKAIPNQWSHYKVDEVCILVTNGFVGTATTHYTDSSDGILYIQGYNIKENGFNFRGIKKVTKEFHKKNSKSCLKYKDLLTIQTGDTGLTSLVPRELEGANCHALIISRFKAELVNAYFILYFYNSEIGRSKLKRIEAGSTMKHINVSDLKALELVLPPLPEQNRIVSVLETWDRAIEKLIKKIEVKKQIKQGLMQNLLTGKKRLNGYSEKWNTVELGEVFDYEQPTKYLVSSTDYDDKYRTPVLTANKGFILGYTDELTGIYDSKSAVIIFDDFTTDSKLVDFKFKVKSSAIKILTAKNEKLNIRFLFNKIKLINFIVGQHKRHYLSEYQYITIDIPKIVEQNAIENILTTAEKEILEIKNKLSILKDQKKYLLNNLITGKIRTPVNMANSPQLEIVPTKV